MSEAASDPVVEKGSVSFRRARRSDDYYGWFRFVAVLTITILLIGLVWACIVAGVEGANVCLFAFVSPFPIITAFLAVNVFRRLEVEFVVEAGIIRTGPSARPERQWKLPLSDVLAIYVNEREREVTVERKDAVFNASLGGDVLIGWQDYQALLEFLRVHHPEVRVVDVATILNNRNTD